jgi:hypothetical protein
MTTHPETTLLVSYVGGHICNVKFRRFFDGAASPGADIHDPTWPLGQCGDQGGFVEGCEKPPLVTRRIQRIRFCIHWQCRVPNAPSPRRLLLQFHRTAKRAPGIALRANCRHADASLCLRHGQPDRMGELYRKTVTILCDQYGWCRVVRANSHCCWGHINTW